MHDPILVPAATTMHKAQPASLNGCKAASDTPVSRTTYLLAAIKQLLLHGVLDRSGVTVRGQRSCDHCSGSTSRATDDRRRGLLSLCVAQVGPLRYDGNRGIHHAIQ